MNYVTVRSGVLAKCLLSDEAVYITENSLLSLNTRQRITNRNGLLTYRFAAYLLTKEGLLTRNWHTSVCRLPRCGQIHVDELVNIYADWFAPRADEAWKNLQLYKGKHFFFLSKHPVLGVGSTDLHYEKATGQNLVGEALMRLLERGL